MQRKQAKGIYDHDKALKAYLNLVDEAARKYNKEFGSKGARIFSKADRTEVARRMRDEFEAN